MSSVKIKGSPTGTAAFTIAVPEGTSTDRTIELPDAAGSFVLADGSNNVAVTGDLTVDTSTLHVDATNNRVGVGTASPTDLLHLSAGAGFNILLERTGASPSECFIKNSGNLLQFSNNVSGIRFDTGTTPSERMRIDSTGNLLVGTTDANPGNNSGGSDVGIVLDTNGKVLATANNAEVMVLNRQSSDGVISEYRKDGATIGRIGALTGGIFIGDSDAGIEMNGSTNAIRPCNTNTPAVSDNYLDLGTASYRWDDVYATNGTIQTSDLNLKTAIASLTDAEITAAKAISKLFKTFKWNDKVEAKGDAARTHAGVIAQEVEQAMTDAGLDAGNYAFFISSTWYEDADGNEVEADTEGATERNRKGIRYPELLAFVGAATEQRLASIEARLDALEAV